MDRVSSSNAEKLHICRRYYLLGFFGLPALWLMNYFWFYDEANTYPEFEEQEEIRKLRRRSGVGAIIWLIIISAWIITFQTNRVKWGAFGDDISFIIPTGSA